MVSKAAAAAPPPSPPPPPPPPRIRPRRRCAFIVRASRNGGTSGRCWYTAAVVIYRVAAKTLAPGNRSAALNSAGTTRQIATSECTQ